MKINKNGHIPDDELIEHLSSIFKEHGVNMTRDALKFASNLTNAFMDMLLEGKFCDECKKKLYDATTKE
jgi:hypothetical protein